ncbi:hypothetical protein [Opitutus terrae]|uniref:Uncharacterized protein n=1 Tax=Opitutus terrae (strain DSM 11246 / JCM 15787 / PB90-1) TaxID=452637 RepID=B1ZV37_OPITP|nr:hypothetical protein [Opitutus terrae]ACB76704.1 hypothetical protein Oter_3427 [Opitutus terrae PB90-1]
MRLPRLQVRLGNTVTWQIDIARDGAAMDLDGCLVEATIKRWTDAPLEDAPVVLTARSGEAITHSAVRGRAFIHLSRAAIGELDRSQIYSLEVVVSDAGDHRSTPDGLFLRLEVLPSHGR